MQKSDTADQTGVNKQNVTVTPAVLTAGHIQALSSAPGQQASIGVLPALSGLTLASVSFTLPRAIPTQSTIAQSVHVSAASLSNTRLVSPQVLNIQRQLSSGIVSLSAVPTQGLQVLPASGPPLTFVTAASTDATAAVFEQQRRVQLLQQQGQKQPGATLGSSGTIHHMAMPSPANAMANPSQSISLTATMSDARQLPVSTGLKHSQSAPGALLMARTLPSSPVPSNSCTTISINTKDFKLFTLTPQPSAATAVGVLRTASTPFGGPSPKKIKLEEKPAPNKEIEKFRQSVCSYKRQKMKDIKSRYREHLTELFYLQGGGNIIEFSTWKKRPSQPLLSFLEGSKLDSDDDSDELQEKRINDEVKVLTSAGSNIPLATPVAISTTLPPSVSALSVQAVNSSTSTTPSLGSTPLPTVSSELQQHLIKVPDIKPNIHTPKLGNSSSQSVASKSIKSTSPGRSRQQTISSVYENVTGGSQDVIVERAKQEAQVLQRVNELRKEGLWSAKRLPRVQEPPRQKAHWDYLLEEMTWLAADFIQERKWKKAAAKKLARMVANHFREQEQKELRAEKEEAIKLKKIASQMAKMVKEFWTNIEKVVQYKQTTRLEEKKKKALDLHLSFIVDQTEKYSSWLTAGLQNADGSKPSSDGEPTVDSGEEFEPVGTASDDEETIEMEELESGVDEDATRQEVEDLKKESEMPLEELLKTLPQEMLAPPSSDLQFNEDSDSEISLPSKGDEDFTADGEVDDDVEDTIEEQENVEKKDYSHELQDLKNEGEMSVEELMQKYAGAYDSDFEMPKDNSSEEDSDDEDDDSSESEKESGESSEEEVESEIDDKEIDNKHTGSDDKQEDVGLEFLVKTEATSQGDESNTEGPGKEFNDIAAAAESLQPKGYTLETTEVKTKVPFLLKHTLREYQHVGLDWLATMHDKRLNGILADEMGLGKTIQTIAVLAHLACDKGVWGPHLIVVPTSVMLNWEMEFKKWCPAFKILTYYGSIKERKLKRQGWTKTNAFHVCITSYKLVVQDHQAFRRKKWKYFILDEAQNIKNFKSQRWQMLLNFSSQRRLLLTGTPLQNSLMELWSLMHFLMPNVFQSHSEFKEWFSNPLTGMIEGSQEYNENLVRRLHKVLRPFLLRRLKNEVEKQMPQKFEHVVMCRLSKRQRYLYDDFMSQTKTRETLATGHFMSVINILMQLRKVCNHPDLFDPRPIVSPFKMDGIVFTTASLATRILEHDPLNSIDIRTLYPNLAEMERDLPAFVSQRIRQLKATNKLIQEVDSIPNPPPRLPSGQLKNFKAPLPAVIETGRASPVVPAVTSIQSRPASPLTTVKLTLSSVQSTPSATVNSIKLLLPATSSSSSSSATQQTVLIPNPSGSGPTFILPLSSISSSSSSAAIAQAKLISSQLQSGVLQLVQTSSGHQILTTNLQTSYPISVSSTLSTTTTTTALPSSLTLSATVANSTLPPVSVASSSTGVSLLKCPALVLQQNQQKPVMRVSPFVVSSTDVSSSVQGAQTSPAVVPVASTSKLPDSSTEKTAPRRPLKKSELFLESLYHKKVERRQHILSLMARLNHKRCDAGPVYGSDTRHGVDCMSALDASNSYSPTPSVASTPASSPDSWHNNGYVNCLFSQSRQLNHSHPDVYWRESTHLQHLVHSPLEWLEEMKDILARFVFVTPSVISPAVSLQVSHPDQSDLIQMEWAEARLRPIIVDKSSVLHPVQSRTMVTFPDLRLIQYDCGKLQRLDLLLRQLKSGQHRVLIFTQMTKMLDVLEGFLNFHGHRYLRLDGTTKVEQRQYLMDRFNADPRIFCFILSTRSGGIGVNLTGADTVIFYDSDWNPTMDAQAQDRCHRIGQTRDVHIYRLVSEMTVEENILKKANQKRLLGDLAIEGGNFTTAFFKEQTIHDLFAEPSGLESLVEAKAKEKEEKDKARQEKENEQKERTEKEDNKKEATILSQFEQALCKAEDETDAQAATQVQAEQKAELAEFDENIPWDERETEAREEDDLSKVEIELAMLDKELTPIERYAVGVIEAQLEPETAEELKMAEEDIENSKKDWELARLKALKEEEERRAELEEDEMLYIYSRDESQVKRGRPLKKNKKSTAQVKPCRTSMSGSDVDDSSINPVARARKSKQSPASQKLNGVAGSSEKKNSLVQRANNSKSLIAKVGVIESKKKLKAAANTLKKNAQKGPPKKRGRKPKSETQKLQSKQKTVQPNSPKQKNKVSKTDTGVEKTVEIIEKKVKDKHPSNLQNGHSLALAKLNNKIATQAKNALLKQQAQQAAHITISPLSCNPSGQPNLQTPVSLVTNSVVGTPARPPPKLVAPKSPADPNVPPPWSNPNLVIRTRKAAVHSPVVIAQGRPSAHLQQPHQQSVLQQSLSRPLSYANTPTISISSVATAANVAKLQGTPDRNIFQLFTPNTSNIATLGGVTFSPGIRQIGPIVSGTPVVNQIRGATLINSVSLVNTASLSGARFITTGVPGQSPVVVSAASKSGTVSVGGQLSNITLVPTVINASGGQTIIPAGGATIVNAAGGARTVLNATRLASPISLQSLGSLPYTVNLIKTNTGLALPVRSQQILQTSLAQVAGQPGYVLITPRMRAPTPAPPGSATLQAVNSPISLVQTVSGQTLQTARVHLLTHSGATVIQQPQLQPPKNINGISGNTVNKTDGT